MEDAHQSKGAGMEDDRYVSVDKLTGNIADATTAVLMASLESSYATGDLFCELISLLVSPERMLLTI
jgi:hypothetical protein